MMDLAARWMAQSAKIGVNVKDFGAIGDGINDDTLAIQQACYNGGVIFFPQGTYKITSTIILSTNATLMGADSSLTAIVAGSACNLIIHVTSPFCGIRNISINANNQPDIIGVKVDLSGQPANFYTSNLKIYNPEIFMARPSKGYECKRCKGLGGV